MKRQITMIGTSAMAVLVVAFSASVVARDLGAGPVRPIASTHRPPLASDSADALAALTKFHAALAAGDTAAALLVLAPDVTILEGGEIQSRAEYAAHHLMADIEYARAVHSVYTPTHVVVQGDVAWIASTSASEGTMRGRTVNSVGAELAVLSHGTAGWQLRSVHWSSHARRRGE